jgi:hypothetical protein
VPAPIGSLHKFLTAGTSPADSSSASAPAGPSVTVPGVLTPDLESTDDPPAPALYIPPALRVPGAPTAPRAATGTTSPAPAGAPPRLLDVPPALRAGSTSPRPPQRLFRRPADPHLGSRLFVRRISSSTTTRVGLLHHL